MAANHSCRGQKQNLERRKEAQGLWRGPQDPRGLGNVWNRAEGQEESRCEAARCCRWEPTWPPPTGSRCRRCRRCTSGHSSWQAPPYLASGFFLEIRTSARERWDEAEVILEDYVEWHDRNHFLLRQKWNRAILFFIFCRLQLCSTD